MLMTSKRRTLRESFGALLADVQQERAVKRRRTVAVGGGGHHHHHHHQMVPSANDEDAALSAASGRAGPFGALSPDLVCLVLQHLVFLSPTLRCGLELREAVAGTVRHAASALFVCTYVWRSFRQHGELLRLEMGARVCTSLMPTNAASDTPYLDQVMLEEHSRLDVRMLESALNSLVCHCAGEHCRGARRAHNESIGARVLARKGPDGKRARPPSTPLLSAVLGGRRPRVKVVWPSSYVSDIFGTQTASSNECLVMLGPQGFRDGAASSLRMGWLCMRDESPEVFDPNTEVQVMRRLKLGEPPTRDRLYEVAMVATTPCGRWIAVVKDDLDASGERPYGRPSALELWEIDERASHRRGLLRSSAGESIYGPCPAHVHHVWFSVGDPYNLCFVGYHSNEGRVSFQHDLDDGFSWCRNGIYQFGVVQEFAEVCAQHGAGVSWMRCSGGSHDPDAPSLRPVLALADAGDPQARWDTLQLGGLAYSAITNMCVSASGNCVAAVVLGRKIVPEHSPHQQNRVAQVVFYECPVRVDNRLFRGKLPGQIRADALQNSDVLPVTNYYLRHGPAPRVVQLSPCGDVAVVMMQATNGEWFVSVSVRVSPSTGFVTTRRMRLEDAIQGPVRQTATTRHMPARRHIRTQPSAMAFSPCGRFLLVAFAFNQEDNLVAAMRSCKPGLCVFDLADAWTETQDRVAERHDAAWIECLGNLLPQKMVWNSAGLWLLARRGVLLLGL